MWLVVGLGNPGAKYELTRHNAGFLALDVIADKEAVDVSKNQFKALTGTGSLLGQKCLFLKPQTFMNLSGQSVAQAVRFYKIPLEKIIVLHDDIDLEFGKVKAKVGGGHGGNNGIRSMIADLGSPEFHRIKFGVGRPSGVKFKPVSDWVLSAMSQEELDDLAGPMVDEALMRIKGIFDRAK